jgi:hypothetical protein
MLLTAQKKFSLGRSSGFLQLRSWIASAEHLDCGKRDTCLVNRNIVDQRSLARIDAIASFQ